MTSGPFAVLSGRTGDTVDGADVFEDVLNRGELTIVVVRSWDVLAARGRRLASRDALAILAFLAPVVVLTVANNGIAAFVLYAIPIGAATIGVGLWVARRRYRRWVSGLSPTYRHLMFVWAAAQPSGRSSRWRFMSVAPMSLCAVGGVVVGVPYDPAKPQLPIGSPPPVGHVTAFCSRRGGLAKCRVGHGANEAELPGMRKIALGRNGGQWGRSTKEW